MSATILVVDDSAFTRLALIKDLPSGLAAHVVQACDGIEALAAFERGEPRLLFLDINMPRMTGLEVLQALRGRRHGARVVVVTSEPGKVDSQARSMGAHCVLRKPWRRSDITQQVREAGLC